MKTLSLTQPWATLVAVGGKQIETRSWATSYRGPLAIHAAKTFPGWARALCGEEPFRGVLAAAGIRSAEDLPRGMVVATCTLTDVLATSAAGTLPGLGAGFIPNDPHERAFGDYSPGRYAWLLADVQPLPDPQPAVGSLGLWVWHPRRGAAA